MKGEPGMAKLFLVYGRSLLLLLSCVVFRQQVLDTALGKEAVGTGC